jgi:hypothetical protein
MQPPGQRTQDAALGNERRLAIRRLKHAASGTNTQNRTASASKVISLRQGDERLSQHAVDICGCSTLQTQHAASVQQAQPNGGLTGPGRRKTCRVRGRMGKYYEDSGPRWLFQPEENRLIIA